MSKPLMSFEEVRRLLKQRFPLLMIDSVTALVQGNTITAVKNVTGNEIQFLGHFPEQAIMPGTLIVEAIGQAASILFAKTTDTGIAPGEFLVLGTINNMRFITPVLPGDRMEIHIKVLKFVKDIALVNGSVSVDGSIVASGQLGFARRPLLPMDNHTDEINH
jgi:3-hydroxyacyl-[acyl-carrier-protein] dehydratase